MVALDHQNQWSAAVIWIRTISLFLKYAKKSEKKFLVSIWRCQLSIKRWIWTEAQKRGTAVAWYDDSLEQRCSNNIWASPINHESFSTCYRQSFNFVFRIPKLMRNYLNLANISDRRCFMLRWYPYSVWTWKAYLNSAWISTWLGLILGSGDGLLLVNGVGEGYGAWAGYRGIEGIWSTV